MVCTHLFEAEQPDELHMAVGDRIEVWPALCTVSVVWQAILNQTESATELHCRPSLGMCCTLFPLQ